MTRMLKITLIAILATIASLGLANDFDRAVWSDADIYALILAGDLDGNVIPCPPQIATPDTSCFIAPRNVAWTQIGLDHLVATAPGLEWLNDWLFIGGNGAYLRMLILTGPPMQILIIGVAPFSFPTSPETLVIVDMPPAD